MCCCEVTCKFNFCDFARIPFIFMFVWANSPVWQARSLGWRLWTSHRVPQSWQHHYRKLSRFWVQPCLACSSRDVDVDSLSCVAEEIPHSNIPLSDETNHLWDLTGICACFAREAANSASSLRWEFPVMVGQSGRSGQSGLFLSISLAGRLADGTGGMRKRDGWVLVDVFFWAFHSLRKYQNTHFFKTRSKLRTESLMFLLPEAGDCVMGWGIILSSRWLCLLQGLQCACLVNSKAKLRPMRNEVSSLQPCLGNWAIVICVPLPCNWFLPTDLLCYYPAGTL